MQVACLNFITTCTPLWDNLGWDTPLFVIYDTGETGTA